MSPAQTHVDLARIRSNAMTIRAMTGVDLIAVVKADAYGLGAVAVAEQIADIVHAWYVFQPIEAVQARLFERTGKTTIAGCPGHDDDVEAMAARRIRPAVWTLEQAQRYRELDPLLSVDTGMQRFACRAEEVPAMLDAHRFSEAMTHASRPQQAARLRTLIGERVPRLHAAGTALMTDPACRLDAVRPGLALYEGAAHVTAPLVDARDSRGPVGYGAFVSPTGRHGVILRGYSNGLRKGPCLVNGQRQQILEVGMQSAYVSLDVGDRTGDVVTLLGDGLACSEVAAAWGCSPQQALVALAALGERHYVQN
jgi:alanine racemase